MICSRCALAARYSLSFEIDFRTAGGLRSTVSVWNGFSDGIALASSQPETTSATTTSPVRARPPRCLMMIGRSLLIARRG